jgi:hypothetical protein
VDEGGGAGAAAGGKGAKGGKSGKGSDEGDVEAPASTIADILSLALAS